MDSPGSRIKRRRQAARRIVLCFAAVIAAAVLMTAFPANRDTGRDLPRETGPRDADSGTRYRLQCVMHEAEGTVAVREEIRFVNETGRRLSSLLLRTWLNAYREEETSPAALDELYDRAYPEGFSEGGILIQGVWWNGEIISSSYSDAENTMLWAEIGTLDPGEEGILTVHCVLRIPQCAWRTGRGEERWQLGNAFPILAVWDGESGAFRQDAYCPIGDPFVSECADYHVTVQLPDGWQCFGTAEMVRENGVFTGEARNVRDMALVFEKGDLFSETKENIHLVTNFDRNRREVYATAGEALRIYEKLWGKYPYRNLSIAAVSFAMGGMEYPCCVLIDETLTGDDLELTLAHEIAHQWFYAVTGSDQYCQAWQDEALCQWAVLCYVEERYGKDARNQLAIAYVGDPMREVLHAQVTAGSPIDRFSDYQDYHTAVYGRGCACLCALDLCLSGTLNDFLKSYCEEFAFRIATRKDFEELLYRFSGQDLSALTADYLDTIF